MRSSYVPFFLALSLTLFFRAPGAMAESSPGSTSADNSLGLRYVESFDEDWRLMRPMISDPSRPGGRHSQANRCPLRATFTASDGTKLIIPHPPLCLKLTF